MWAEIVKDKICKQAQHLEDLGNAQAELLKSYIPQVEGGDVTNREGHAAKVYFNALFGMEFKRGDAEYKLNSLLNYGYAIVLSAFNREVVSCGYLTQCGIFHRNEYNYYNLSCDLMEPFRVLVDRRALALISGELDVATKRELADLLNSRVTICGMSATVSDAIATYAKHVFRALDEGDPTLLEFYECGI